MPIRLGLAIASVVVAVAAAATAFVTAPPPPNVGERDWGRVVESAYVGDAECARCHRDQAESHATTGHARTLTSDHLCERFAELLDREIPDPERAGRFRFECRGGQLVAAFRGEGEEVDASSPIQFAVGSGQHAVTFLTLLEPEQGEPRALEHRLSQFAEARELRLTPSHVGLPVEGPHDALGRVKRGNDVTTCIGCHSTTGQVRGTRVDDLRAGVGCESCHGPGRRHVAARAAGRDDAELRFGSGRATAAEELQLCGRCHRSTDNLVSLPDPDDIKLTRFQPVGLSQSACFRQSDGVLRCTTCHDPHAAATARHIDYDEQCRRCHTAQTPTRRTCPVEPAGHCTSCHMPVVEVHPGIRFHDHWIRQRNPAAP